MTTKDLQILLLSFRPLRPAMPQALGSVRAVLATSDVSDLVDLPLPRGLVPGLTLLSLPRN